MYRVKVVYNNGEVKYSNGVTIENTSHDFQLVSLTNNSDLLDFVVTSNLFEDNINISIYNMAGQITLNSQKKIVKRFNSINENISSLEAGTYLLFMTNSKGDRLYKKFVK